jgi:hypothetical protein
MRVLQVISEEARCPSCGGHLMRVPMAPKPCPGLGRFLFWLIISFLAVSLIVGPLMYFSGFLGVRKRMLIRERIQNGG